MSQENEELTPAELTRIQRNRERAEQLRSSQIVTDAQSQNLPLRRINLTRTVIGNGGFIPDEAERDLTNFEHQYDKDEEPSDPEEELISGRKRKRTRRKQQHQSLSQTTECTVPHSSQAATQDNLPIPPDVLKPQCDSCNRLFDDSFLSRNFDVYVCDRCRDPKGIHALITKSTAKERYLLNDVDLDVREPKLRFLLKRNPHHSSWGSMHLYLEAQIAERALSIWGSEEAIEAERQRRTTHVDTMKLKKFNRKIKELKVQTRSSLFMKTHKTHEHIFDEETYDSENDVYNQRCKDCGYVNSFEKL